MAAGASSQPRRAFGSGAIECTPEPFNPVAELRREIMPIVAQMAGLAGGDPKPLLELAKPKRRTSRRK